MLLFFALSLISFASAQTAPTDLSADGSSGTHFADKSEACDAAKTDASAAVLEECAAKSGTGGDPVPGDCSCEQGGFEDSEWLCSTTATLACAIEGNTSDAPTPAASGGAKLKFDLPATLEPLPLVAADFSRRGLGLPVSARADLYQAQCTAGWGPACRADTWYEEGRADLKKAVEVFGPACEEGDETACLVWGWSKELEAERNGGNADLYKAAARKYKSLCDGSRNTYACYEYGSILFNELGVKADPRLGIRRWDSACKAGEGAACTVLAKVHRSGARIKPDSKKARRYANAACTAGDPYGCIEKQLLEGATEGEILESRVTLCTQGGLDACWTLASAYLAGEQAEPSPGMTRSLLDMGCELQHGPSCLNAGNLATESGDDATAGDLYRSACRQGEFDACGSVVDLIQSERIAGSVKQDLYSYELACSKASKATACSELGLALMEGESVGRDTSRARALLRQSCVDQNSPAKPCFVLGDLFETGAGGDKDRTLAARYFKWACAQGWGQACDRRGDLLDKGVGVRENDGEAVASYQLGCDAGLPSSCHKAAVILDEASIVAREPERALKLYAAACDSGVAEACLRMGRMYEEESNAWVNFESARDAYEKGVALKNVESHRRLARLLWNGIGGGKSKRRAKALCATGCKSDDPIACRGPSAQRND